MKSNQDKKSDGRGHLTASEISCWLVEGPSPELSQHLDGCFSCQAKLTEAQEPLTAFRTAFVAWSEARDAIRTTAVQRLAKKNERHWDLRLWLPAASVALAALLLVGYAKLPGFFLGHSSGRQTGVIATTSPDSDAALMDQVDTEVSEAVPDAMAPLTDLVAWDSNEGAAETTAVTVKSATHKKSGSGTSAKAHAHAAD